MDEENCVMMLILSFMVWCVYSYCRCELIEIAQR